MAQRGALRRGAWCSCRLRGRRAAAADGRDRHVRDPQRERLQQLRGRHRVLVRLRPTTRRTAARRRTGPCSSTTSDGEAGLGDVGGLAPAHDLPLAALRPGRAGAAPAHDLQRGPDPDHGRSRPADRAGRSWWWPRRADPFSRYLAEILRAEGLNEFELATGPVTSAMLAGKEVVVLGSQALTDPQVSLLTNWVQGGGNLIAMRPDKKLAGLLGLTDAGEHAQQRVHARGHDGPPAGSGIDGQTLQFHGTADRYTLGRPLRSRRCTRTRRRRPRTPPSRCGRSGRAAGRPPRSRSTWRARWSTRAREIRPGRARSATARRTASGPNDLFYGAKAGDVQPDWVDMCKVDVPQADEQQRLLANLVTRMNLDRSPLPRFWYLPRGEKAAVVMTGDDHATGGTSAYFNRFKATSDAGLLGGGLGVRARDLVHLRRHAAERSQATAFQTDGFELALHVRTGCQDFTPESLETTPAPTSWPTSRPRGRAFGRAAHEPHPLRGLERLGERAASVERAHGIRLDTNYYYLGPPGWLTQAGAAHGLGLPAALRRPRRLDDRRLPGDDSGHRRVRAYGGGAGGRPARQRAREQGLLRRASP